MRKNRRSANGSACLRGEIVVERCDWRCEDNRFLMQIMAAVISVGRVVVLMLFNAGVDAEDNALSGRINSGAYQYFQPGHMQFSGAGC